MKEHIRKRKIMAVTLTGSLANFLLLVFKFVAGVLGHSSAMIADAVHRYPICDGCNCFALH